MSVASAYLGSEEVLATSGQSAHAHACRFGSLETCFVVWFVVGFLGVFNSFWTIYEITRKRKLSL